MSTSQQGEKEVRKVLTRRKESGIWVWALLKTGGSKGTVGARLDEEGAKLARGSERESPDVPVGWQVRLHLI